MPEMDDLSHAGHSVVPRYVIDLSDRPRDRYVTLAFAYKAQIGHLTMLFNDLLLDLGIPQSLHRSINRLARVMLRRLHSSIETEEIRGIATAAQIPIYLLVAFNVVLDLLMGCTSGAVRSLEIGRPLHESRMLHFRTLDWGMDSLRSVIVQLDFIKSKSSTDREIVASSITYVGFVGVLTGVRKSLSMSLNFRAVHNADHRRDQFKFYIHHLLVLLSLRQSISSLLRCYLLDESGTSGSGRPKTLGWIASDAPTKRSTAAYLIFSDGNSTITIEKDHKTAIVRQSQSFIAITNHDLDQDDRSDAAASFGESSVPPNDMKLGAMHGFLEESVDRRDCIVKKWERKVRKEDRRQRREAGIALASSSPRAMTTRSGNQAMQLNADGRNVTYRDIETSVTVTQTEVISWVSAWPTTNECTHYAVVLDPRVGRVAWLRQFPQSVTKPAGQDRRQDFGSTIRT